MTNMSMRKSSNKLMLYILLILVALFMVGPFLWLLSTSLKTNTNLYKFPPQWIPHPFSLHNFIGVWTSLPIPRYLWNTIYMTGMGVGLNLVFSATCAYPLAKIDFPGRKIIFGAILSILILPNVAGMIVNFITLKNLHLIDTMFGVVIPSAVNVFNIFLLRQAYSTLPNELADAARIDGCSEFYLWWKIMLPLVRPALSTVVIFEFMTFWNNFLWPIVVLQDPNKYPLAAGLTYLTGQFSYNFGYIAAGTIISVVPIILIFVLFQKQFINGVVGSVKG